LFKLVSRKRLAFFSVDRKYYQCIARHPVYVEITLQNFTHWQLREFIVKVAE